MFSFLWVLYTLFRCFDHWILMHSTVPNIIYSLHSFLIFRKASFSLNSSFSLPPSRFIDPSTFPALLIQHRHLGTLWSRSCEFSPIFSSFLFLNNTFSRTQLFEIAALFYYSPHSHSIAYIFFPMSQSIDFTGIPSAFSTDVNCNTCGRLVEFKPCVSNRNGNKGVMFAIVRSSPACDIQVLNFKYYSVIMLTKSPAKAAISSKGNQGHLAHHPPCLLNAISLVHPFLLQFLSLT